MPPGAAENGQGGQQGAGTNGNGDGSGNGSGNGAGGEAPKYLTVDEFNKAWSAREKRMMSSFEKSMADAFAKFAPKPPPNGDGDEDDDEEPAGQGAAAGQQGQGGPQGTPQADPKTAKELRKLQKRLEASEAERAAEKKAREEQTAKSQRDELRAKVSEQLSGAGIAGAKLRGALSLLIEEDKKIRRDQDGAIVFVEGDDEIELAEGLKKWFASDDGKAYLPPRGASGAGTDRPRGATGNRPSNDPKAAREAKSKELFRKAFGLTP